MMNLKLVKLKVVFFLSLYFLFVILSYVREILSYLSLFNTKCKKDTKVIKSTKSNDA